MASLGGLIRVVHRRRPSNRARIGWPPSPTRRLILPSVAVVAIALATIAAFGTIVAAAVSAAVAGTIAGAAARVLLRHLPRGTSVRPGWCEIPVALLWTLVTVRWAAGHLPGWWVPTALLLTWFAVALGVVDLRHRRLPDALTLGAYPVAVVTLTVAALGHGLELVVGAVFGAVLFLGLHAAIRWWRPRTLGAGDVKLSGSLGAVLGAVDLSTLVLATVGAAIITLALAALRRPEWWTGVPHGPGLLATTSLIALFPGLSS
ncbi:prepilin peptidase [Actinokineospora sp.]|uniref:prepilin peptidase n=1 Tax=Actinokineospora sp. TaxID=1872133 RepID=UPI004037DDBE